MEHPFFSVIIPTYNAGSMLKNAVDSVLQQTFTDLELLIIDNHSTDDTDQYLKSVNDPRVKCYEVHNHGRVAVSRNYGAKMASGTWLAFLDADDEWYAEKLHKVFLAASIQPGSSVLYHMMDLVSDGKCMHKIPKYRIKGEFDRALLMQGNPIPLSSSVVKRSIFISAGGFLEEPRYATVEDFELWMRLAPQEQFHFIPESLGIYNWHESNTSKSRAVQQATALLLVVENFLSKQDNIKYSILMKRNFLSRAHSNSARLLQKAGYFSEAAATGWKGIKQWPLYWKNWLILIMSPFRINH